jgi:hypothetical protein
MSVRNLSVFFRIPGVTLVWYGVFLILTIALTWIDNVYFDEYNPYAPNQSLWCRYDGDVLIADDTNSYEYNGGRDRDRVWRDIAGATVTVATTDMISSGSSLSHSFRRNRYFTLERIHPLANDWDRNETWYLVRDGHEDGRAVLVAYDISTNLPLGYLYPEGFFNDPVDWTKGFLLPKGNVDLSSDGIFSPGNEGTSWHRQWDSDSDILYLMADSSLYRITRSTRSVKQLITMNPDEELHDTSIGYNLLGAPSKQETDEWLLLMRTSLRIIEVDKDGNLKELPLPKELNGSCSLTYYGRSKKGPVLSVEAGYVEAGQTHTIYHMDEAGNLLSREEVTLLAELPDVNESMTSTMGYALLGSSGIFMGILMDSHPKERDQKLSGDVDLGKANPFTKNLLRKKRLIVYKRAVIGLVCSLAFALFALFWERRYHGTIISQVVWSIYVLLFGLPGLIGYLTHRKWPVRLPCVHCGTKLPVTSTVCSKCSTPVPPPEHTPREIFA